MNNNLKILEDETTPTNSEKNLTNIKFQSKTGLKNLGNTCYFNAALQCLAHSTPIKELIKNLQAVDDIFINNEGNDAASLKKSNFTKTFIKVMQALSEENKEAYNPTLLKDQFTSILPDFYGNLQHDSHEALIHILDILHSQINSISNNRSNEFNLAHTLSQENWTAFQHYDKSFIVDNFYGQLISTITCLNCKSESVIFDPFSSIGLSVPNDYNIHIYVVLHHQEHKIFNLNLCVNDHMSYKDLALLVNKQLNTNINNYVFYFVLNNKLKFIADNDDIIGNLLNRPAFIFLCENIHSISLDDELEICVNFISNTRESKEEKIISFPRVFKFNLDDHPVDILNEISEYYKNNLGIKDSMNSFFYSIKTVKVEDNFQCLVCNKEQLNESYCQCIAEMINKGTIPSLTFRSFKSLNETIEINMNINIRINPTIECKLNRSKDIPLTSHYTDDLNLRDLLKYFTRTEKLKLSDNYSCKCCDSKVEAIKLMEFNKLPDVLIFTLKRFRYEKKLPFYKNNKNQFSFITNYGEKNDNIILFDKEIDMTQFTKHKQTDFYKNESVLYRIYAVIYHTGKINQGHYTAVCKCGDLWFEFDDKMVRPFEEQKLVSNNAYILFYERIK